MLARFIYFFLYFLSLTFFVFLLYFNFRGNNNTATLVPATLLDSYGFNASTILVIKSSSDKIAHFGSGFLLCFILFFMNHSKKKPRTSLFDIRYWVKWCGFLIGLFFVLELSQWAYRKAFCGVDFLCLNVYFSWLDVVSSFGGAILALALIMIIQSRTNGQIKN